VQASTSRSFSRRNLKRMRNPRQNVNRAVGFPANARPMLGALSGFQLLGKLFVGAPRRIRPFLVGYPARKICHCRGPVECGQMLDCFGCVAGERLRVKRRCSTFHAAWLSRVRTMHMPIILLSSTTVRYVPLQSACYRISGQFFLGAMLKFVPKPVSVVV
jgi:hypothetical protein